MLKLDTLSGEEVVKILFEHSFNSIAITDANLELPGPKFVYVNPAFTKKTGYTLEELQDKTPRILQGEETDRDLLKELKAKCQKGEFFQGSTINYRKDGTKYHVEWNISPIRNEKGEITHFISMQKDITKEVEYKKLLEDLSHKLSFYISPQIYESIYLGKQDVSVKSTRKPLTIFFSDLVGFTKMTEELEPEVLSDILNSYLDEMVKIALKYGATIDKFIGDAVMLFFGDPKSLGLKEDALQCVLMALEMRQKVQEMSPVWMAKGLTKPLQVRMGISSGNVTVGNFGSNYRIDYTIVGEHVNLASRLESKAKPNTILISQQTNDLIKDKIATKPIGELMLKGIAQPISTYEVVDTYEIIR
ncbi:MAG: PAS domain S-box protein [Campylobacterales bacterium]|nr:PAS domain S-box protein [Campylobacterales bacterium]